MLGSCSVIMASALPSTSTCARQWPAVVPAAVQVPKSHAVWSAAEPVTAASGGPSGGPSRKKKGKAPAAPRLEVNEAELQRQAQEEMLVSQR